MSNNGFLGPFGRKLFRRNSIFLSAALVIAFGSEILIDNGVEGAWNWNNKGVYYIKKLIFRNYGKISPQSTQIQRTKTRFNNKQQKPFFFVNHQCPQ